MGREPIRDPPWTHDHGSDFDGGSTLTPDSLAVTAEDIILIAGGSIETYPSTEQGLRDAFSAVPTSGAKIHLPTMSASLGTTGLSPAGPVVVEGAGKRETDITADDGVGVALDLPARSRVRDLSIRRTSASTATSEDTAIKTADVSGFYRFDDLEISGWWKGIHLFGTYNSRIRGCEFTAGQSETNQEAQIHIDPTANTGAQDNWVLDCYFYSNQRCVWVEDGPNHVVDCDYESNDGNEVHVGYGDDVQMKGLSVRTSAGSTASVVFSGGSGEVATSTFRDGQNAAQAIKVQSTAGGPVNVDGCTVSNYSASYGITISKAGSKVADTLVEFSGYAGVQVNAADVTVTGVTSKNNDQNAANAAYSAGIYLQATDISVVACRCYDDQGTATQDYGVSTDGSSDYNSVTGCTLRGNATASTNGLGTNTVTAGNV